MRRAVGVCLTLGTATSECLLGPDNGAFTLVGNIRHTMINNIGKILVSIAFVGVAAAAVIFALRVEPQEVQGSAPSGLQLNLATSSLIALKPTPILVFATSTNCGSRVITSTSTEILIQFGDIASSTATDIIPFAHKQFSSSTVEYDSGIYGCGAWRVQGITAGRIHVSEFR